MPGRRSSTTASQTTAMIAATLASPFGSTKRICRHSWSLRRRTLLLVPPSQLASAPDVELEIDAVQVILHGALGYLELLGDLFVPRALDDELGNASLGRREPLRLRGGASVTPQEVLEGAPHRLLLDPAPATVHLVDALEQQALRHLLQDHPVN